MVIKGIRTKDIKNTKGALPDKNSNACSCINIFLSTKLRIPKKNADKNANTYHGNKVSPLKRTHQALFVTYSVFLLIIYR